MKKIISIIILINICYSSYNLQILKKCDNNKIVYIPFDSNKLVNGKQEFYLTTWNHIVTNIIEMPYSFITVKQYYKETK